MKPEFTPDEIIATCISRRLRDGDIVVQGLSTPLTLAGYILAKCTHAPNLVLASAVGMAVTLDWKPLSLVHDEAMWLDRPLRRMNFPSICREILPTLEPREFLRPAQVDPRGHFNNVCIGDWHRPRLRLPGCGGIADITPIYRRVELYVPRHDARVFVPAVDFVSGVGHIPDRPRDWYLVSDLATFDLHEGQVRLVSLHPGVSLDDVRARTGFPLRVASPLSETPPPTAEELRLLREEIDPLGIRKLETVGGAARAQLLKEIIHREMQSQRRDSRPYTTTL